MNPFLATFFKDLLILWRDRAGMLVLFLMPMILVLVVSLVQNNILAVTGHAGLRVLFLDQDKGFVAEAIRQRFQASGEIELITEVQGKPLTEERARREVDSGHFQFALLIPAETSARVRAKSLLLAQDLSGASENSLSEDNNPEPVQVFFDPGVQGVFRTAVLSSVRYALLGVEMSEIERQFSSELNAQFGITPSQENASNAVREPRILLKVREHSPENQEQSRMPNAVQQNVPAYALFGMFFIVVPLSGALLRERQDSTLRRLLILPVPYWVLLAGKTLAYVAICLVQFGLMLLVGKFLLPLMGTPVLQIGNHPGAVFLLALCAALAATGSGMLLGTWARSYEQASMLGAVSVVIAAALGGVMVPVYMMPQGMQKLSSFSPLAWGLDGFIKLFVRSGDLASIQTNLWLFVGFFLLTLSLSIVLFSRQGRSGG